MIRTCSSPVMIGLPFGAAEVLDVRPGLWSQARDGPASRPVFAFAWDPRALGTGAGADGTGCQPGGPGRGVGNQARPCHRRRPTTPACRHRGAGSRTATTYLPGCGSPSGQPRLQGRWPLVGRGTGRDCHRSPRPVRALPGGPGQVDQSLAGRFDKVDLPMVTRVERYARHCRCCVAGPSWLRCTKGWSRNTV